MGAILKNIPLPPSMNMAYPSAKNGRRFKSKQFKCWEAEFKTWALVHNGAVLNARNYLNKQLPGHYIYIHTQFCWHYANILTKEGKPKRNDTSNRIKMVHDALAALLWLDDSYFFDGSFTKRLTTVPEHCNAELTWVQAPWMLKGEIKNDRDK